MDQNTPSARALRALRAADQTHQGRIAGGMGAEATNRLAALDASAHSIRAYSPILVPGLLQTTRYAAGAIKGRTPSLPAEEIQDRVRSRWARNQRFLERWKPAEGGLAWFLMGEAAIRQPMCNIHAHANQLTYLLQLSAKFGRVVIQVLPDYGTHGIEPFSLHALEDGQRVGHLETLIGGWYTTVPEDITRLHNAFSDMMRDALTPADTRELIKEELQACWGTSAEPSTSSPPTATPTTASTWPVPPLGPLG